VDIQDYEQWSHDQASVCACVCEHEFEVRLCVARVIDLSGFWEYYIGDKYAPNMTEKHLPPLDLTGPASKVA